MVRTIFSLSGNIHLSPDFVNRFPVVFFAFKQLFRIVLFLKKSSSMHRKRRKPFFPEKKRKYLPVSG